MRAKLILLLVGAMILIRSGPLPACLLDEAVAACFCMTNVPVPEHQPVAHAPTGNDTPDEVNRGWSQQQTFGNDGSVSVLAHVLSWSIVPTVPPVFDGADSALDLLVFDAPPTSPPPGRPACNLPLLT